MELSQKILNQPHLLGHYLGYKDLSEIHSTWIIKSWANKKDYILQAHRNSYKTTAVLVVGCIWYLLYNPEATILIVRKEYEGAASILKSIIKHYESDEMRAIYEMFGFKSFNLKDYRKDTLTLPFKKQVTKEGSIDSLGIGGAITGRHYDKIICDDIVTLKDRVSKAERDKTKAFAMELMNIKKPNGTITVTGTPWHRDDVFTILPESDKYPMGSVCINGLNQNVIDEIKARTTPSLYAINYLLKHVADENKIFSDAKFEHWDNDLNGIIGHIDCAYSGTHYTALTLLQKKSGYYIIKGWIWRESIVTLYEKIANLLNSHNCGTIHMEDNADKGLGREGMIKYYPNVLGYHEKENKHNKIILHLKQNWLEVRFDYGCQEEYLNQVMDYEEGEEPDDAPDSLASLMRIKVTAKEINPLIGLYSFDNV